MGKAKSMKRPSAAKPGKDDENDIIKLSPFQVAKIAAPKSSELLNPKKFMVDELESLAPDAKESFKRCGKPLLWASGCDGSNMPGYVLKKAAEMFDLKSTQLFGSSAGHGFIQLNCSVHCYTHSG